MDLRLNRKGNSRTTRRDGNSVKLGKTPSISVSINGIRLEKKRKRNVQLPTPSPKKKTKEGTNWNRSKHSDPKMAKSQKSPQKKKKPAKEIEEGERNGMKRSTKKKWTKENENKRRTRAQQWPNFKTQRPNVGARGSFLLFLSLGFEYLFFFGYLLSPWNPKKSGR